MLIAGIQQAQSFQWEDTRTMNARYLLYLPKTYDPNQPKRWPLILFLHGAGQRGNPANVCAIKHLPIWTFHGARDKTVPIGQTENLVEALKNCGGNVRFTIYPHAGHDAWTKTYANPELYTWFLKHTRMVPSS